MLQGRSGFGVVRGCDTSILNNVGLTFQGGDSFDGCQQEDRSENRNVSRSLRSTKFFFGGPGCRIGCLRLAGVWGEFGGADGAAG
jgi:hypothetical protein